VLPLVLVMLCASTGMAQEQAADTAKALLAQGQQQYKAMDYKAAQQTLLRIKPEDLSAADQKTLEEYLSNVRTAVREWQKAKDELDAAATAEKAGNWAAAAKSYEAAAASQYLPAAERDAARAKLALVNKRMELAANGATTAPATTAPAAAAVVVTSAPAGVEARTAASDDAARAAKARQWVAAGKGAMDQGEFQLAKSHFQQAVELDPANEEAKRLLDQAAGAVGGGESTPLDRLTQQRAIARQEARIEFDNEMQRSRDSLQKAQTPADFAAAADAARRAQAVLQTNRELFPAEEYKERQDRVTQMLAFINTQQLAWEERQRAEQAAGIQRQIIEREQREADQRKARIVTLSRRADVLRSEHKYRETLEVLEQILQIDPNNEMAAKQIEWARQMLVVRSEYEIDQVRQIETQKQWVDIRESEIPWYEYLRYPKNWKEITLMRESLVTGTTSESPADRQVRQRLKMIVPKLAFNDIPLENVIQFLRDTSGASIYVNWQALQNVTIQKDTKVNVTLENVSFEKALRVILEDVGGANAQLTWVLDDGVITISTRDELIKRTVTRVYDIRDLMIRVPNFAAPQVNLGANNTSTGNNNNGGTGGGWIQSNSNTNAQNEGNIPTKEELVKKIVDSIASTIDPDSWRPPVGQGTVGSIRELHGNLLITTTREDHEKINDLFSQLRESQALQIAIEARFISVSSGFLENIGLDLDVYFNLGSNLNPSATVDPWTGASVPVHTVSPYGPNPPGNNNWSRQGVVQNSYPFTSMLGTATNVQNGIGASVTADALTMGGTFLDDIQVNYLIRATQAQQETRTLTAPRLTVFDGQHANINVGTTQAYVSDLTPVISANATTFQPSIGLINTGTLLDVEATVSHDRRYVTMTIQPTVSLLNGFTKYFTDVTSVDADGNPLTGSGFIQLPNVTQQTLQTTVNVPDGGTLLIGGQKLSGAVEREMGVPLLSKIPVLNRAFSNRGFVRDEQTLLILVKPKIIIQAEQEQLQAPR
jgi:general secretion pathway protein D